MKNKTFKNKCHYKSIYIKNLWLILVILFYIHNNIKLKYEQDDLAIVSAYYKIKSKYSVEEYLNWIKNIVLLNKSIVFFTNKEFMDTLIKMRPKELHHKTKFIEVEMINFYTYKNFIKTLKDHLILIMKIVNFREKKIEMEKYSNLWPSTKKCFEDNKILMGKIKNFSESDKEKIVNFDKDVHKKLERNINVCGDIFGGQIKNTIRFINFYYKSIRLFLKKIYLLEKIKIFILM